MSKLAYYRQKLHLTQQELANKSGISIRTIQRIESGTIPKGHTLIALLEALDIKEEEFFEKKEAQKNQEIEYSIVKLVNTTTLLGILLPPFNIVIPLSIMFFKKQFNPLTKQLISIQILWTVFFVIMFLASMMFNTIGNEYGLQIIGTLIVFNVFMVLRNAIALSQKNRLHIRLNFSLI